jgi:hypothetical protein
MLEKLTKDFISKLIIEMNKKENRDKLEKEIMDPLFCSVTNRIYPYVSLLFLMYSINIILIIIILLILYKKNI